MNKARVVCLALVPFTLLGCWSGAISIVAGWNSARDSSNPSIRRILDLSRTSIPSEAPVSLALSGFDFAARSESTFSVLFRSSDQIFLGGQSSVLTTTGTVGDDGQLLCVTPLFGVSVRVSEVSVEVQLGNRRLASREPLEVVPAQVRRPLGDEVTGRFASAVGLPSTGLVPEDNVTVRLLPETTSEAPVALSGVVGPSGVITAVLRDPFSTTPVTCAIQVETGSGAVLSVPGDLVIHRERRVEPIDDADFESAGFGFAFASAGDWLAVGAWSTDDDGTGTSNVGGVHVYQLNRGVWIHQEFLPYPGDAGVTTDFGIALDFDGTTLVVGATRTREAFFYELSQDHFELVGDFQAVDALAAFGYVVDVDGDLAVVGSRDDGDDMTDHDGEVQIFRRLSPGQWERSDLLQDSGDRFGSAVALSDDRLAVGDNGAMNRLGEESGVVQTYQVVNGVAVSTGQLDAADFPALDTGDNDSTSADFGVHLSMSADVLVVGAHKTRVQRIGDAGAALVYERVEGGALPWRPRTLLTSPRQAGEARFGRFVAVDDGGERIGVSAYDQPNFDGVDIGAVFIFERVDGDWSPFDELPDQEPPELGNYGGGLRWGDRSFLVGAQSTDVTGVLYEY